MEKTPNNDSANYKKKIVFGLYGAGGFAREVMPFVTSYIAITTQADTRSTYQIFFVETDPQETEVNGYPLISENEFLELKCAERFFNIAIGDPKVRERIANDCLAKGAKPMSVKSPHAIIYDCNEIGEGAIICANTMITSNAKIGKFFHSNIYSYVAHDCVIGDYVTFAPNVHCNGNVHIHNHAYIGTDVVINKAHNPNHLSLAKVLLWEWVPLSLKMSRHLQPLLAIQPNLIIKVKQTQPQQGRNWHSNLKFFV